MKKTILISGMFCAMLSLSCSKGLNADGDAKNTSSIIHMSLKTNAATLASTPESQIDRLDVYSFVKLSANEDFTFEKRFENLAVANSSCKLEVYGSPLRKLYFVANNTQSAISYLDKLDEAVTAADFESQCLLISQSLPGESDLLFMTGITTVPSSTAQISNIDAELSFLPARIDVVNKYTGFKPDSLILRDAVPASHLFNTTVPEASLVPRKDFKYTIDDTIYMYQTNNATLTVYGKYNGLRVVFDIPLLEVKRAMRYKITMRGIGDSSVDFANNLAIDVKEWLIGTEFNSQPDWK